MELIRRHWHALGVQGKLHLIIQGALIVVFFLLMSWVEDRFETQIDRAAEARAEETADGLINGMNMLMLTGKISDPDNRKMFVQKMTASPGILEVRIIRGQAIIDQYGVGLAEEQPVDELDRQVLSTGRVVFKRVTTDKGRQALRVVVPFIAQENFRGTNCLSCHSTQSGGVNGAASVTIDLTAEELVLTEIKNWLWIGHVAIQLILLVFISVFVRFVIAHNITKPVSKLQIAMRAIRGSNDLSKRVEVDELNADISDMAQSFNQLLDGLESANERLDLFAKMFENSGEAIIITDANKNILAANPAFVQITQYSLDEVIGKNPKILSSGKQKGDFYKQMWECIEITGQWSGEIWNRRKNGEIYPEWLSIGAVKNAKGQVINYISSFSDITKRKEAERRIEFLAHYDSLTKLPNRTLFQDRLQRALIIAARNKAKVGLMFLDLDKFKSINDTLGHLAGDQLLQSVAERLTVCLRESDTLCRQGGDEFLILLENINSAQDVERIAAKIMEAMSRPHLLDKHVTTVTFSIGVAIYPDDAESAESLIKRADEAMYVAKQSGRNNFKLYQREVS